MNRWRREYLQSTQSESRQSSPAQTPPEKPAIGVPDTGAVFTRGGVIVPASKKQEVNTSEIQKTEIENRVAPSPESPMHADVARGEELTPGVSYVYYDHAAMLDSIVSFLRK